MTNPAGARGAADVVARHLAALSEAGLDRAAFDAARAALADDPAVRKAELDAIQHAYIRGRPKRANRAAALAAIDAEFLERLRAAAKREVAEKSRPW